MRRHGLGLAFGIDRPERFNAYHVADQAVCRLAEQDRPWLRELLQTSRQIGGVAHGRIVHTEVVADATDNNRARVQSHPDDRPLTVNGFAKAPLDAQSSEHSAARMVLVRDRRPEERHQPIAEELIDGPFVPVDLRESELKDPAEERVHGLGAQALGEGSRVGEVGKQYSEILSLTLKRALGDQDLVGQVFGSVGLGGGKTRLARGFKRDRRAALVAEP